MRNFKTIYHIYFIALLLFYIYVCIVKHTHRHL